MTKYGKNVAISEETEIEYVWKILNYNDSGYISNKNLNKFLQKDLICKADDIKDICSEVSDGEKMLDHKAFHSVYSRIVTKSQFTEAFDKKFQETINEDLNSKKKEKTIIEKWLNLEFGTSYDLVWLLELTAIVLISVYVFSDMFEIREQLRKSNFPNPDNILRPFSDLWIMAIVCVITFIIKKLLFKITDPYLNKRLAAMSFPDHTQRLERLHDFSLGLWFYGTSIVFTYYTFWGNPNVTWMLGGTNDNSSFLTNWPNPPNGPLPYMNIFYPIQMGYHLHSLIFHIICRTHKATYIEMILHHYLTWFLIFYSYFTNYETFGLLVLMCHDIGDFLMNIGKLVRDLQLAEGWKLDIFYLNIVVSWFYPRTIVAAFTYIPASMNAFLQEGQTFGPFKAPIMPYVNYTKFYAPRFLSTMLIALWI